jgi:L-seryl-tRNA(Ser) seleniumtransferase
MTRAALRTIPSVDKILRALGDTDLPAPLVVDVVRKELAKLRAAKVIPGVVQVIAQCEAYLRELRASRLQPVINGTGVVIHTNFGRAPLSLEVIEQQNAIALNYSNLEYDLTGGARGGRAAYLKRCLALLCGADEAAVVNNNAAALLLILRHFCQREARSRAKRGADQPAALRNEVIISRGELIQIGGGFRIPEILEAAGARLREVGTTNKTSLGDYRRAIGKNTAMILKVHRSNFYMEGFVASPRSDEIAALAGTHRILFVEDLGSGAVIQTQDIAGLQHEVTPAESLKYGAHLVCFSGDKLLGGPQCGIIAGKAQLVKALEGDPYFRALRCDKLVLAALQATVDWYLRRGETTTAARRSVTGPGTAAPMELPVLAMMRASQDELRARAQAIVAALAGFGVTVAIGTGKSQAGGGALPRCELVSATVDVSHPRLKPQELSERMRARRIPIIGYVLRGKVKIDLRTVFPSQDQEIIHGLQALPS